VTLTAALTLTGVLPALTVLGGSSAAPALTLSLGATPTLLADWGAKAVVWPQVQQLALLQLLSIVRGAAMLTLAVGAATLLALHLARTATRSAEVVVARAVGASRRDIAGALMLEATALAGVALFVGMIASLLAVGVLRAAWPGQVARADLLLSAAGTLAITALVMVAPLLLMRALTTTRLVDDDRRPLTLIIPALQLGAALVVLAGGATMRDVLLLQRRTAGQAAGSATIVQELRAVEADRLQRAQGFARFLDTQHALAPSTLVSLGSSGVHRALGAVAQATGDCGNRCAPGTAVRGRTEDVAHHAVSGDTFAVSGVRVLRGRALNDGDRWDSPLVAVINRSLAQSMFGGSDPVGQRLQLTALNNAWFEIVGVVADAPARGLGAVMQPTLGVYVSVLQHPVAGIEVATTSAAVAPDALRTIGTTLSGATSIAQQLDNDARVLSWFTKLLLAMGVIASVIAIGGLLTMLSLWLESQKRELGVRRAVGARRRDIHALVLGRASLVAIGGCAFGAWLGLLAWDVLPRIVPGAPAWSGPVVVSTALMLSVLTLVMAWLVSHRFTRAPIGALILAAE
jgi:putative ABC transport system permease protein